MNRLLRKGNRGHVLVLILWVCLTFGRVLCYDPATCVQCRESHLCNPPECFCCRDQMPLSTHTIPQMVFFSFDDAVTPQVASYYKELFDPSRKNPNGCPISMTLFISHRNTVYGLVKDFYKQGMEIASHSVTHSHPNPRTFLHEARKQKENLAKNADIPMSEIKGWRSPFLEPLGDTQPSVLKDLGYEYDATLTITPKNSNDKAITPFTLDYGWPYDCKIKPCPENPHKGFWEVPVVSVKDYLDKYDCVYIDGCNNPPPSEALAYKFLWDNFQKYYTTNRAPMGINMHASWFYYPDRKAAMNRFIKELVKLEDVYIVSINQVIQWLKDPTPVHQLKDFQPWNCHAKNTSGSEPTLSQQSPRVSQVPRPGVPQTQSRSRSSWQSRQQQLMSARQSATPTPPLVPNLPMVRFWWQTPQAMSNRNIAIQRNRQTQQAHEQQRRQEAAQRKREEEERRRRLEAKRKADEQARLLEEKRVEEQRRLRLEEQEAKRRKIQHELQEKKQTVERKRLELERQAQLQKQRELEQKQMEELKRKELLKQEELERHRQNMLAQQELERKREIKKKQLEIMAHQHSSVEATNAPESIRTQQNNENTQAILLQQQQLQQQREQAFLQHRQREQDHQQRLIQQQRLEQEKIRKQQEEQQQLEQERLQQQQQQRIKQQELQQQKQQQQQQQQHMLRTKQENVDQNTQQRQVSVQQQQQPQQKPGMRKQKVSVTKNTSPFGNKLNTILRLPQTLRISRLEELSLMELKALQNELRNRLLHEKAQQALEERVSLTDKAGLALEILSPDKNLRRPTNGVQHGMIKDGDNANTKLDVRRNMVMQEFHAPNGGVTRERINKANARQVVRVELLKEITTPTTTTTSSTTTTSTTTTSPPPKTTAPTTQDPIVAVESKPMWNVDELDRLNVPWRVGRAKAPIVHSVNPKPPIQKSPVTFLNVHTMKTKKTRPLFSSKVVRPSLFGDSRNDATSNRVSEVSVQANAKRPVFNFKKAPVAIKVDKPNQADFMKVEAKRVVRTQTPAPMFSVTVPRLTTAQKIAKALSTFGMKTTLGRTAYTPTTPATTTVTSQPEVTQPGRHYTSSGQVVVSAATHVFKRKPQYVSQPVVKVETPRPPKPQTTQKAVNNVPKLPSFVIPSTYAGWSKLYNRQPKALCEQGINCIAPDCFCKTYTTPYNMKVSDIPQMVYITVDGSLNFHTYSKMRGLFSRSRKNPNGCPVKGTVFISDTGSSYSVSSTLAKNGIEVGMMGLRPRTINNATNLGRDLKIQRDRIVRASSLTSDKIKGWRSPGFKPSGDSQFTVLANLSLYDSSLVTDRASAGKAKLWPHTLDFGWSEHCAIERCPHERHPGVWEVPVIPFVGPANSTQCEVTDGCARQPKSEQETFDYLMNNFNNYYNTNRAPFAIRLKQIWFHWFYRDNMKGLLRFLDTVLGYGDVYMTSISDMIDWIKSPVPLKDVSTKFAPWQCNQS